MLFCRDRKTCSLGVYTMQFSLKYILALTAGLSLSPLHAEMVQSSSLTNDVEGSNLAARVLSKDSQNFNSRFYFFKIKDYLKKLFGLELNV
jgi:hypothetical protein